MMPAAFLGHGTPMNALDTNRYRDFGEGLAPVVEMLETAEVILVPFVVVVVVLPVVPPVVPPVVVPPVVVPPVVVPPVVVPPVV